MKPLLTLLGCALAGGLAYLWQRQKALTALPTAEHKDRFQRAVRWTGTRWEKVS